MSQHNNTPSFSHQESSVGQFSNFWEFLQVVDKCLPLHPRLVQNIAVRLSIDVEFATRMIKAYGGEVCSDE